MGVGNCGAAPVGGALGVRVSGDIRNDETACAVVEAGATRLGVSSTAKILAGAPKARRRSRRVLADDRDGSVRSGPCHAQDRPVMPRTVGTRCVSYGNCQLHLFRHLTTHALHLGFEEG